MDPSASLKPEDLPLIGGPRADHRSLEDVHGTVAISRGQWWRRLLSFSGPAFMVSVGYMDPGNWATDLAAGARFGYNLIWVILISNLMAILLQTLSARLGIVTGRDLAQACRDHYPRPIVWVLWITNAFNLIDGLDGLAAGSALFSTVVNCVVAIVFHNEGILFLTLVLAGAIAGFLRYNFNPASIFLGDSGSTLIGFLLSAMAIAGSQKSPTVIAVAIPIVSLGLPILDVAVAVVRRFLSCKGLFDADREHIHHKLLSRGISHRQAVLVLYGVSACFGLLSLFLLDARATAVATVLVVVGMGVLIGVQHLRYPEFLELAWMARRTLHQRHVIANDINIRRTPDALGSCNNLAELCQVLQHCLEPAGFDGFGLSVSSELPTRVDSHSVTDLQFFWDPDMTASETNWGLTFSLRKRNGKRLGSFALYRQDASSPLGMDLDVLTATGFSNAVAGVVEKLQDSWSQKAHEDETRTPRFEMVGRVLPRAASASTMAPMSG